MELIAIPAFKHIGPDALAEASAPPAETCGHNVPLFYTEEGEALTGVTHTPNGGQCMEELFH